MRPADSALIMFPGSLGDFICFLPTLVALRARHPSRMLVVAKPVLLDVMRLRGVATASIDGRALAQLFASSPTVPAETEALLAGFATVYSWTGFGDPDVSRHLTVLTAGRVNRYRFRGMDPGEHAVDYYARCVGVTPSTSIAESIADDPSWFAALQRQQRLGDSFAVIHPGSGSSRKNWIGFGAVVRCWRRAPSPVVLLRGPAEVERDGDTDCGADIVLEGLTLPQVATVLRRTRLYLGNDSGISHLAAAVGATGVALFGPTDPATWAPRGPHLQTLHAPEPCWQCGAEMFCLHRLPVERVLSAVDHCIGR
jgi:heptosyltransferase-3